MIAAVLDLDPFVLLEIRQLSSPSWAAQYGSPPEGTRVRAVDVFRGVVVAAMILVNAQFSQEDSYGAFAHAAWNGWTFADTIFPAFLFIVGVSLTLATAARTAQGQGNAEIMAHALRRSLLLFAAGVVVDYVRIPVRDFPFVGLQQHVQLTGVLQKIAVCYLASVSIYLLAGVRGAIAGIVALNVLYLGLLDFYPVPGCGAGSLSLECNFPGYFDEAVLDGFRWNSTAFDPDGLGSILPAVTSVLFGVLAGQVLASVPRWTKAYLPIGGAGVLSIALGTLLSLWIPINKHLWTTSFAVFMAGVSATELACTIWLVDCFPQFSWRPLEILGRNAIAAYVLSRVLENLPRVHIMGKSLYSDGLARMASPPNASLLFAMLVLAMVYSAVWLMNRRGLRLSL